MGGLAANTFAAPAAARGANGGDACVASPPPPPTLSTRTDPPGPLIDKVMMGDLGRADAPPAGPPAALLPAAAAPLRAEGPVPVPDASAPGAQAGACACCAIIRGGEVTGSATGRASKRGCTCRCAWPLLEPCTPSTQQGLLLQAAAGATCGIAAAGFSSRPMTGVVSEGRT